MHFLPIFGRFQHTWGVFAQVPYISQNARFCKLFLGFALALFPSPAYNFFPTRSKICCPTPFIHHTQFHACFSCCQSRVISLALCSCSYKVSHYLAGPNNNPCYVHCDGLLICGSFSVTETNGCVERWESKRRKHFKS